MLHLRLLTALAVLLITSFSHAQTGKFRCYFNTPVNSQLATAAPATYLVSGFPDSIAAYINRAKYTVDIAMYNYTASAGSNVAKIAVAANNAAARGVRVRWLYNGTSGTANTGLSLLNAQVNKFAGPNWSSYIMHNKFMVIDVNAPDSTDAWIQTGSFNFSDAQANGDVNNIIFIQSKQVATAYYDEFNKMWGSTNAAPDAVNARFSTNKTASSKTRFLVDDTWVEVYFSPKDGNGSKVQDIINQGNDELFFGVYTFTDNTIATLLKNKYNAGIRVRGIMDEFSTSYTAYSTLLPVLGNDLQVHTGSDLYHDKVLIADAGNTASDPTVITGSFNWTGQAQTSNDENTLIIHNSQVANAYYQAICHNFTNLGGFACVAPPCIGKDIALVTSVRGSSYQWQVNTGTGFTNISDGTNYTGAATANLLIKNSVSSWYGYQFRCWVNQQNYSDTTTLRFVAYWNGQTSTNWHQASNWNCGVIPDSATDVIINPGVKFFPQINQQATCRSVRLSKGATATLLSGIQLLLTGSN